MSGFRLHFARKSALTERRAMPRELITIQIGQCGNQIGCRFWDLALREHASHTKDGIYNEAMSTFFRNVDSRYEHLPDVKNVDSGDEKDNFQDPFRYKRSNTAGTMFKNERNNKKDQRSRRKPLQIAEKIHTLKARAILVDMEEGVLNSILKDNLGTLFDEQQLISDVSGSGNNWAHGHEVYGKKYANAILESIRRAAECCDSLQSFFLIHSMGGGTGSGLGTYILEQLKDNFEDVYRFTTAVFPSEDDDVITSPYNSVLALRELVEHADCVLPIDNQSLYDLTKKSNELMEKTNRYRNLRSSSSFEFNPSTNIVANNAKKESRKPFDQMNNIAANLLTNLTCSMRFEGNLNVDLNEITMNLVPYPKLHFLLSSVSPLILPKDIGVAPRSIDAMFSEVISKEFQLMKSDPKHSKYLAMGLLVRGDIEISDINRNIVKLRNEIDMIYWNEDGFKVGSCSMPPVNQPYSLLCLANNCCIKDTFSEMEGRFMKLYKKKAHLHHYTEYMELSQFQNSLESLKSLIDEYNILQNATPPEDVPRFVPEL
jgi:tubulin epsilon